MKNLSNIKTIYEFDREFEGLFNIFQKLNSNNNLYKQFKKFFRIIEKDKLLMIIIAISPKNKMVVYDICPDDIYSDDLLLKNTFSVGNIKFLENKYGIKIK